MAGNHLLYSEMLDLVELGRRIQALRLDRALTLQALAEAASVSVSMLSSVEHGQKAPTILVLARIAEGLRVPLADLVTIREDRQIVVRRAADQDTVEEPGGWRRAILSPVVPGVNFEWIRTTLPPGCDAGWFPAYAPGSHEFLAVHSGHLRLTIGETTVELAAGDSAYFAADQPHAYANTGTTVCTYDIAALIMRPRSPYAHSRSPRADSPVT
jgi:transcriptional regulator with XRE-family HTH domain